MKSLPSYFLNAAMLGAVITLQGCDSGSTPSTPGAATSASGAAQPASLTQELGVQVPTQAEADAAAAQEITTENADEAFDQLQQEIESEG